MKVKRYRDWKILSKILAIPVIALVVGLISVELLIIPFIEKELMEGKDALIRHVVELGMGVLEEHAAEVKAGRVTLEEAQRRAISQISRMRYDQKEYLWINDLGKPVPRMIMHPTVPGLNGKVLDDPKFNKATSKREGLGGAGRKLDSQNLFTTCNEVCEKASHGYVSYRWPKPKLGGGSTSELYQKVSYVKKFEPWGWILGSGVYVDYVKGEAASLRWWIYGRACSFMLFLGLLASWVGVGITRPLNLAIRQLKEMTSGNADLTQRMAVARHDESGVLTEAFNAFLDNLHKVISNIRDNASNVANAAHHIKLRAGEIVQGAGRVASDAATVATAGEEMAATAIVIANNCVLAAAASKVTTGFADEGAQVVQSTIFVMGRIAQQVNSTAGTVANLGSQSDQIGAIIGTIEDIADQTNLLALNAAIEAARAGDQGRGFAVVADEVRALAVRTTKATKEISSMIKAFQSETNGAVAGMNQGVSQVEAGTVEASRSGSALEQIRSQVEQVTQQIDQIATAAAEQTSTTTEISANIERITEQATRECAQADGLVEAAHELNRLAESMISSVNRFQTIIKWNDGMSVGVPEFDAAHKKLITMIGQLDEALQHGQSGQVIRSILDGLTTYCKVHFEEEERYLEQHGYPASREHQQVHVAFMNKVGEIVKDFNEQNASPLQVMNLLSDWLLNHILKTDKKYTEYFIAKGVIKPV